MFIFQRKLQAKIKPKQNKTKKKWDFPDLPWWFMHIFSVNHTRRLLRVKYMNLVVEESCRKHLNQWTSGVMEQMIIRWLNLTRHIITTVVFLVKIHKKIIIWNYHEKNVSFLQISVHIYLPCSLTVTLYLNSLSYQYTEQISPNYFFSQNLELSGPLMPSHLKEHFLNPAVISWRFCCIQM